MIIAKQQISVLKRIAHFIMSDHVITLVMRRYSAVDFYSDKKTVFADYLIHNECSKK